MINWWNIEFGRTEIDYLKQSILERKISQGKNNLLFEKKISKLLKVKYCITSTSGTTAIIMALKALNIKKDDEIILPNRNWIASANAVNFLGAKVKLVDVHEDRPIINEYEIEKVITKKTKVIIPTHLNGRGSNMNAIKKIAKKYNLKIIEDSAQALLSKYKNNYLGTLSDVGIFSMAMTKILSTGQGGFLVTNDVKIYKKICDIKNHGLKNPFQLDWSKEGGINFKFTDLQAALGLSQLKKLNTRKKKLLENYDIYKKGLKKISFLKILPVDTTNGELPLWIECMCDKRDKLIKLLNKNGIEARPSYPSLSKFKRFNKNKIKFFNSNFFEKKTLYLPSGVDIKKKHIFKVLNIIEKIEKRFY